MLNGKTNLLALAFLLGIAVNAMAQTPARIVEGPNLNIGSGNTLTPNGNSFLGNAIGTNNVVQSTNALAVGDSDTIGLYSNSAVALGYSNKVQGVSAIGIGYKVTVDSHRGLALGHHIKATGILGCMVIGNGIVGSGSGSDAFLINNSQNSLMIGFNSTKPTLFVSESPNNYYQNILDRTGKVAIGDVTPTAKLHVRSDDGEAAGLILEPASPLTDSSFIMLHDNTHAIKVSSQGDMRMTSGSHALSLDGSSLTLNGKVGVNTENTTSDFALAVDGGLVTTKVYIKDVEDWMDRVFEADYALMPLGQLRDYIGNHHHLPDLPSEAEVTGQGYDMGEVQAVLLKKIEELTLYTLRQQEEIDALKKALEEVSGNQQKP